MTAAQRKTFITALLFVLSWNSGFIGAEFGLPYSGPFTLLFWRYLALSILLGGWLVLRGTRITGNSSRVIRLELYHGFLAHGVWLGCVLLALEQGVPAGLVALVTALQPLLTGAFSGPVTGEKTDGLSWIGLLLGFAGVTVVITARMNNVAEPQLSLFAWLLPFCSAVAMSGATLWRRRKELSSNVEQTCPAVSLFWQSNGALLFAFIPAIFVEQLQTDWQPRLIYSLLWLVPVVSLGAYLLLWKLIKLMDAIRTADLFYAGPPVTMLFGWLLFGDRVYLSDLPGLLLTAAGIALVLCHKRR